MSLFLCSMFSFQFTGLCSCDHVLGNNINFEGLPTGIGKLYNLVNRLLKFREASFSPLLSFYHFLLMFNFITTVTVCQLVLLFY